MNDSEFIAKCIFEEIQNGIRLEYQEDQSHGEPDFYIIDSNGNRISFEVTTSHEKKITEIYQRIKNDILIPTQLCSNDWLITPCANANINKIKKYVDRYLHDIEIEGLSNFFYPIDDSPPVIKIYNDLKIEAGDTTKWKNPGFIGMTYPSGGGLLDAQSVIDCVEAESRKSDNL